MIKPLKIGILGAANIAKQFTDAVRDSRHVMVVAVASRNAIKANEFAVSHKVAIAFNLPFEQVHSPCGIATGSGLRFCAEAFAAKVRAKDFDAMQVAEQYSLDNATVLDALARSARSGQITIVN